MSVNDAVETLLRAGFEVKLGSVHITQIKDSFTLLDFMSEPIYQQDYANVEEAVAGYFARLKRYKRLSEVSAQGGLQSGGLGRGKGSARDRRGQAR